MIVPISSARSAPASFADVPSQTNLLMALATMHQLGKFNAKDSEPKAPAKPPATEGES